MTYEILHFFSSHTKRVASVVQLREDNRLVTCGWDETIKIWDVSTFTCLETFSTGKCRSMCCSLQLQDGQLLVGSLDSTMKTLNMKQISQQKWERCRHFLLVIKAFQILNSKTSCCEKHRVESLTLFFVESMRGGEDSSKYRERLFCSAFISFFSTHDILDYICKFL